MFSYDSDLDAILSPPLLRSIDPDNSSMPTPFDDDDSGYFDDSASHLDQSFCSNFSCCGQTLPDLHRLLDHFEEEHVLPLTSPSDSRPLYSSPVYAHPRPSGPNATYILSYPQPDPPLHPASLSLAHPRFPPPASPISTTPSSSPSSCYSSPTLGEPLCLPPALFSVQNPPIPAREPSPDDGDSSTVTMRRRRASAAAARPCRTQKQYTAARIEREREPIARTPAPPPPHRRRDGREKAYKCPHPGCLKSYLNPNGLKYHLEKGTCTNADERPRGALPAVITGGPLPVALSFSTPPPATSDCAPSMDADEDADAEAEADA